MVILEFNTMSKYAIAIFYSDEDEGYIAVVPELPNCRPAHFHILTRTYKKQKSFYDA